MGNAYTPRTRCLHERKEIYKCIRGTLELITKQVILLYNTSHLKVVVLSRSEVHHLPSGKVLPEIMRLTYRVSIFMSQNPAKPPRCIEKTLLRLN